MKYKNEAGEISLDCNLNLSKYALDIYKELNPQIFPKHLDVPLMFHNCLREISLKHDQEVDLSHFILDLPEIERNNKVLLAFSGGLDSCYQAFCLKELNYDVILFHVKNMNYYTNGKEYQSCVQFSKKYEFNLITSEFKQNTKDNPYKKYWKENSFKNILLYSMMIDYCVANNIYNLSSGDDLRLDIKDSVVGTNVSDAKQITNSFFKSLNTHWNINFIPTQPTHKGIRLKKLIDYDCLNIFYSCVNPGRFNQSNHNRIESKFNVKLEKWNCGVCRKCAFHTLLRHYYLKEEYPQNFIDFCWDKICNGADYEFFKPSLPLNAKIQNLFQY